MKARQLIASAAYSPDQIKIIAKAFENAWEQVALLVSKHPDAIEAARLTLAEIVLAWPRTGAWTPSNSKTRLFKKCSPTQRNLGRNSSPIPPIRVAPFGSGSV
jgi:hypothetical protein